jgi:phosphatidylserine/phosphatidylglycerophosphate/cardiolipin synthase-like enzyme
MGIADRAKTRVAIKERVARLVLPAECWIGDQVSDQICAHHRRRLRKIGWESVLDVAEPEWGWASVGAPVRPGNSVDVLIDGAEALPAIAAEMRAARSHVHVTGWCFTPSFALEREGAHVVLRHLLAELAERVDVRVLAWAGAPLPLFRPSRKDVRAMRDELIGGSGIRCELDAHERPMHCHHEKTIVIDDRIAFVGGIDLTAETADRFDTNRHPARAALGWHDVSARIEGPAVADVAEHFRMRWHEVCGERLDPVQKPSELPGGVEVQIVRTVPEHIYQAVPRGDFGILETYLRALRAAERFIYLENQFMWSPEIVNVLVDRLRHPPSPDFRVLVVLPAVPNSGADSTRGMLARLIEADDGAGRVVASALYARSGPRADPIYVHAKVGIVDDRWLTIGSANLNEHSLFNDTEMNLVSHDATLATDVRLRLWAEHLEQPIESIRRDPVEVIDELWKPIGKEQLERREADLPLTHRLVRLPGLSRHSSRTLGPLTGMLVDG